MAEAEEWQESYSAYSRRLAQKPNDQATLCNRSFVLLRLNRYEEALQDARRCVETGPDLAKGHLRCAQALDKLERQREALNAVTKAIHLDPNDAVACKLLLKVDKGLQAGLRVLQKLVQDAEDRRTAVRAMLDQSDNFTRKWAQIDIESRRKLVVRMLSKGFEEIKCAFIEHFEPLETASEQAVSLSLLQQEVLVANIILMSDAVDERNLLADSDSDEEHKVDRAESLPRSYKTRCGSAPRMLRYIIAASENRENSRDFCGDGMSNLMANYSFPPFRNHPQGHRYSADLIRAQRSTLCLVVSHLLLGGDGLPTATPRSNNPDDDGAGMPAHHTFFCDDEDLE